MSQSPSNFWNGSFAKHRDYEHSSFGEHERANGARYSVIGYLYCDSNPIDGTLLSPSELYYVVQVTLHNGSQYTYLVEAEDDNSAPNDDNVFDAITEYAENPVPGGRNFMDYVDVERSIESAEANIPELDRRRRRLFA